MSVLVLALILGALVMVARAKPASAATKDEDEIGAWNVDPTPIPFTDPADMMVEPVVQTEPFAKQAKLPDAGAWEWELKNAIEAGHIPPPPEGGLITTAAWYWSGKEWEARTRAGFAPISINF